MTQFLAQQVSLTKVVHEAKGSTESDESVRAKQRQRRQDGAVKTRYLFRNNRISGTNRPAGAASPARQISGVSQERSEIRPRCAQAPMHLRLTSRILGTVMVQPLKMASAPTI